MREPLTCESSSLLSGYRAHAIHRAHQRALVDDSGVYSFSELWHASTLFAGRLRSLGVRPGATVGVAMEGSAANVAALVGAMLAGVAAAPLNLTLTASEQNAYLQAVDPALIVADPRGSDRLPIEVDRIEVRAGGKGVSLAGRLLENGQFEPCEVGLGQPCESPALLFPTGGTTGLPKAAILSHRAAQLWAMSMAGHGRSGAGTELFFLSFFHVGLLTGLLSSLYAGAPVVIQPRFDPERACDHIVRNGATRLQVVPTHLRKLQQASQFEAARHDIRHVRFGGMSSAPEFVDELLTLLPNAEISTGYGSTEFGPVTLLSHSDLVNGRRTGVGRALPGVQITILSDDGCPLAPGEVGDVVIRCPWQASGYVGRPDETAYAFRSEGVRLADCGFLDEDGWLQLLGRRSDMVITGGENVFPPEIEAVLLRHPDVAEVVVIGVPDASWGERVEAVVVANAGAELTIEALRDFARAHLAPYKLPRSLLRIDRIPLTANNKPDRQALRDMTAAGIEAFA